MCRDISMSEFYKPLSEGLTIKESGIHGVGIFATQDIPKGTRLGLSHMLIDTEIFRTPLGGFIIIPCHQIQKRHKKDINGFLMLLKISKLVMKYLLPILYIKSKILINFQL